MSTKSMEIEKETKVKNTGTVKFFNTFKGYGFIIPDEPLSDGKDIFIHHSEIIVENDDFATLNMNDEVEFELHETDRGYEARKVVITKEAPYTIQKWDTFY
jgi:cold shock CspA family protein